MEKILQELSILKTMKIKPNYSELARKHGIHRDTIRKYDNGYKGKPLNKPKLSVLDKYQEEIKEKLLIPGTRISSIYRFLTVKYGDIGSESNFRKYVQKNKLKINKQQTVHPRYETEPAIQLQFDWKENMQLVNKYGEIYIFNILTAALGHSRKHVFEYSKTKTREDVIRCLVNTFIKLGGVPYNCLTDHMSSIISNGKFSNEFVAFGRDFGFNCRKCKVRSPQTKGKVESKNRFLNWLKPYNGEFETEEELIAIIKNIENIANGEINATTGVPPNVLFEKEKPLLQPLPNKNIIEAYLELLSATVVSPESLIYYNKKYFSVPHEFIGKTVKFKENDNILNILYDNVLIRQHQIVNKTINYNPDDYINIFKSITEYSEDIESLAQSNLKALDNIGGVNF